MSIIIVGVAYLAQIALPFSAFSVMSFFIRIHVEVLRIILFVERY